jgi:hypothetical protein
VKINESPFPFFLVPPEGQILLIFSQSPTFLRISHADGQPLNHPKFTQCSIHRHIKLNSTDLGHSSRWSGSNTRTIAAKKRQRNQPKRGGSRKGRAQNLPQDFESSYQQLYQDYFAPTPVYTDFQFCQRFRVRRTLFLKIVEDVEEHNTYFTHRADAVGNTGLRGIQKITSSLRILAYGGAMDANDEYIQIGESTAAKSLYRFCQAIIDLCSTQYL